ncbi:MAG: hypothetical protein NT062_08095 [Proteobacteria bacterium]|nr:hypothetical protein [Pseudomonadota bacterium]
MPSKTKRAPVAAPRILRRPKRTGLGGLRAFDVSDATWTTDPSIPEAVFDRATGPFGAFDEET